MPTDSIIDNLYVFYTETGEKHKLGQIKDIELTATETESEEKYLDLMKGAKTFSCSCSCSCRIPAELVYLAFLSAGAKDRVPNNWLKRHKYPMNRRKRND